MQRTGYKPFLPLTEQKPKKKFKRSEKRTKITKTRKIHVKQKIKQEIKQTTKNNKKLKRREESLKKRHAIVLLGRGAIDESQYRSMISKTKIIK